MKVAISPAFSNAIPFLTSAFCREVVEAKSNFLCLEDFEGGTVSKAAGGSGFLLDLPLNWLHMGMGTRRPTRERGEIEGVVSLIRIAHLRRQWHCARRK